MKKNLSALSIKLREVILPNFFGSKKLKELKQKKEKLFEEITQEEKSKPEKYRLSKVEIYSKILDDKLSYEERKLSILNSEIVNYTKDKETLFEIISNLNISKYPIPRGVINILLKGTNNLLLYNKGKGIIRNYDKLRKLSLIPKILIIGSTIPILMAIILINIPKWILLFVILSIIALIVFFSDKFYNKLNLWFYKKNIKAHTLDVLFPDNINTEDDMKSRDIHVHTSIPKDLEFCGYHDSKVKLLVLTNKENLERVGMFEFRTIDDSERLLLLEYKRAIIPIPNLNKKDNGFEVEMNLNDWEDLLQILQNKLN